MKALELLYQCQQADEVAGGYMSKPIEEAINELETFKNRSCDNCQHGNPYTFSKDLECTKLGADT